MAARADPGPRPHRPRHPGGELAGRRRHVRLRRRPQLRRPPHHRPSRRPQPRPGLAVATRVRDLHGRGRRRRPGRTTQPSWPDALVSVGPDRPGRGQLDRAQLRPPLHPPGPTTAAAGGLRLRRPPDLCPLRLAPVPAPPGPPSPPGRRPARPGRLSAPSVAGQTLALPSADRSRSGHAMPGRAMARTASRPARWSRSCSPARPRTDRCPGRTSPSRRGYPLPRLCAAARGTRPPGPRQRPPTHPRPGATAP